MMKSTNDFPGQEHLSIFVGNDSAQESSDLTHQMPFIDDLFQRFEDVTGWTLVFNESRSSRQNRKIDEQATVFGELEIDDMSPKIEPGKTARHRGYSEQLAQTLDAMVHIIQADRQRFRNIDRHLAPPVRAPFEWWGIEGNVGYQHGSFASWSVSQGEKIRAFFGLVNADNVQSSVLSSATLLALFETVCQTTINLEEIAPVVNTVKGRSSVFDAKLVRFATVELDPITGEFEMDGYDPTKEVALIDIHAGTILPLDPEATDGILYSGQVLALGVNQQMRQRISEIIDGSELTVEALCQQVTKEFEHEASLLLYRR